MNTEIKKNSLIWHGFRSHSMFKAVGLYPLDYGFEFHLIQLGQQGSVGENKNAILWTEFRSLSVVIYSF